MPKSQGNFPKSFAALLSSTNVIAASFRHYAVPTGGTQETDASMMQYNPANVNDGFRSIKAALKRIHQHEEYAAASEVVLRKIALLEANCAILADDPEEERRMGEFLFDLRLANETFLSWEKDSTPGSRIQSDRVFRLLDYLRLVTSHYSMARWMAIDKKISTVDLHLLNRAPYYVRDAEYRRGNRTSCLRGTRSAILDQIDHWARDPVLDESCVSLFWLNGPVGTGKSAIAQTIAERMSKDGRLGASFFCSRESEKRSDLKSILPTLAFQLAYKYPGFRSNFIDLTRRPDLNNLPCSHQMRESILEPLDNSDIRSTVIVIDGLDECKDEEYVSRFISIFQESVPVVRNSSLKFFITSRRTPSLERGFRHLAQSKKAAVTTFALHEVESDQVKKDIRLFFEHEFSEIKRRRNILDDWPAPKHLDELCERADGLFIYAKAMISFIDREFINPRERLRLLLRSPESSVFQEEIGLAGGPTICSRYTEALREAVDSTDPDPSPRFLSVFGAVILARSPISPPTIAILLGISKNDVRFYMDTVSPFVSQGGNNGATKPFHQTLPTFVTDKDLCTDKRFHISSPTHHKQLLIGCLKLMNEKLDEKMSKPLDAIPSSGVDIKPKEYIDALNYACTSWYEHLARLAGTIQEEDVDNIGRYLDPFLREKWEYWKSISLPGALQGAEGALEMWRQQSQVALTHFGIFEPEIFKMS